MFDHVEGSVSSGGLPGLSTDKYWKELKTTGKNW